MALNPGTGVDRDETVHDARLAGVYRAAAGEKPTAQLDDAIRAAARREAGSGPRPLSRLSAWRMPLSLAAVVVLSVTVVLMMREEGIDPLPQPDWPATARKEVPTAVAPAAAPESPLALAPSPTRPAAPAALPQPEQPQRKALPQEAETAAVPLAVQEAQEAPAPVGREALPASPPRALMRAAPAVSAPVPAAADRAAGPASPRPASLLWQDLEREAPEQWIRRIAELRREGRTADAEALLAEFRRRFPDRPPPEDLR